MRPHQVNPMDPAAVVAKYKPLTDEVAKRITSLELVPPTTQLLEDELYHLVDTYAYTRDTLLHIATFALKLAADIPGDIESC